jgi:catechol 2,3-dioxygenase-like lactoylglutathione lyase family enzyme
LTAWLPAIEYRELHMADSPAGGHMVRFVRRALDRYAARNVSRVLVAADRLAVLAARSAARETANQPRGSAGTSRGGASWLVAAAVCGLFALGSITTHGQAPAPGAIVGTGTFTSFVENMDRSLAFYHDVFGMEVPAIPESGERPYNRSNPQLFAMFDIPDAKERHQSARVPGTRLSVEVMEVQNVPHQTHQLRIQDPGNATLVLVVRDIDAALASVTRANAPIVTPGGKPVTMSDGSRAILINDIDTRFVEIRQPTSLPEGAGTSTNNIVDVRLSISVNDMERTTKVYRDVLGFTLEGETPFAADKATRTLTGLSKAEVRRSRVQAPGSALWIEFVEFKGVERTPLKMRIQDRGAARLQLRAQNLDAMVDVMKSAGLTVVSQGGTAVPIPPNLKGALVADPNNFFLTPFAPCDGCTSRTPPPVAAPAQH